MNLISMEIIHWSLLVDGEMKKAGTGGGDGVQLGGLNWIKEAAGIWISGGFQLVSVVAGISECWKVSGEFQWISMNLISLGC